MKRPLVSFFLCSTGLNWIVGIAVISSMDNGSHNVPCFRSHPAPSKNKPVTYTPASMCERYLSSDLVTSNSHESWSTGIYKSKRYSGLLVTVNDNWEGERLDLAELCVGVQRWETQLDKQRRISRRWWADVGSPPRWWKTAVVAVDPGTKREVVSTICNSKASHERFERAQNVCYSLPSRW